MHEGPLFVEALKGQLSSDLPILLAGTATFRQLNFTIHTEN